VKDVLVALVPVLVAVIPAALLYRQSIKTAERESDDRAAERQAEERRRDQELAREEMRLRETGQLTAAERERERFAAFLRVVHQIRVGIENAVNTNSAYVFPPTEQMQLASTYEDLMLYASDELAAALAKVRETVSMLAEDSVTNPGAWAGNSVALDDDVADLRKIIRGHLSQ
jgi:hypothetical protein